MAKRWEAKQPLGAGKLSEEHVSYGYGGKYACHICHESADHGMPSLAYAYRAEIYGEYIKSRVGGTLEDAGKAAGEGVGSVGCHGIYHHAS